MSATTHAGVEQYETEEERDVPWWGDRAVMVPVASGVAFVAGAGSAEHRVSGSVLTGPVKADPRTLGPLLGVGVRYTGEAWEIGNR